MTRLCETLQEQLADLGAAALSRDDEARRHLAECDECAAFFAALNQLDASLVGLPTHDAPDAAVERIVNATAVLTYEPVAPTLWTRLRMRWPRPRLALSFAATAVVAMAALFTTRTLMSPNEQSRTEYYGQESGRGDVAETVVPPDEERLAQNEREDTRTGSSAEVEGVVASAGGGGDEPGVEAKRAPAAPMAPPWGAEIHGEAAMRKKVLPESDAELQEAQLLADQFAESVAGQMKEVNGGRAQLPAKEGRLQAQTSSSPSARQGDEALDEGSDNKLDANERDKDVLARLRANADINTARTSLLQQFRQERAQQTGLQFQEPRGYWANAYVPGDPAMRLLQARLARRNRQALQAFASAPLRLDAAARQTAQPFDKPTDSALAVYLHADRRGLQDESRMLVQVGLRATQRSGSRRPAMNVAIVLDVRGSLSTDATTNMRALLTAVERAQDIGDRFSLTVAGKPGGLLLDPAHFKHGPLAVASGQLFGEHQATGETLGLVDAVQTALKAVREGDDPTAPLGSSAVLLVTSQTLGDDAGTLAAIAHQSAVDGIPLSVVGVGQQVRLAELDRVALAGQGNRRLLSTAAQAKRLVERELSAVSRAVARAVRLRIRLAPGVKLVDVLGSRRLDESQAQQTRQAEQSIDQRLSQNLGIQADRGEDEDGIQIIIPSFYAGDAHVILLDVVASGPGAIADVTVRYKDLVYLRNGVTRASLSLDRSTAAAGPLERNVLKNLLALQLSDTLAHAGQALAEGRNSQAVDLLRMRLTLLDELPGDTPAFAGDPDLANQIAMLNEYVTLLQSGVVQQPEPRAQLADSLRLAGQLVVLPPPPQQLATAEQ